MSSITNQPIEKGYSSALGPSSAFSPLSLDVPARLSALTSQDFHCTQRELRAEIPYSKEAELLVSSATGEVSLQVLNNESAVNEDQSKLNNLEEENANLKTQLRLIALEKELDALEASEDVEQSSNFTTIDELIEAMTALKTTLKEASTSSKAAELKPVIIQCIQKAHELCKRSLAISTITFFDQTRFLNLCAEVRKGINALEKLDSSAFDYQFYSKKCNPFSDTLFEVSDVLIKAYKSSDNIEQGTGIGGGTCHGHSLAVHNLVPVGEESIRVASFLQSSCSLSQSFLNTNFQEVGKAILSHPDEYPSVMHKAALLLGVKKEQREGIVKVLSNPDSQLRKSCNQTYLEILIGRLAVKEDKLLKENFKATVDSLTAKKKICADLAETYKLRLELETQTPTEKGLQTLNELQNELRSLDKEIEELIAESLRLTKGYTSLENLISLPESSSVSSKIMLKRKLKREAPLFEDKALSELLPSLQSIAHLKGKYNLTFLLKKSTYKHTIAINFDQLTFCDIDDSYITTEIPKLRQFTSADQMLNYLSSLLETEYAKNDSFTLTPITNL